MSQWPNPCSEVMWAKSTITYEEKLNGLVLVWAQDKKEKRKKKKVLNEERMGYENFHHTVAKLE